MPADTISNFELNFDQVLSSKFELRIYYPAEKSSRHTSFLFGNQCLQLQKQRGVFGTHISGNVTCWILGEGQS